MRASSSLSAMIRAIITRMFAKTGCIAKVNVVAMGFAVELRKLFPNVPYGIKLRPHILLRGRGCRVFLCFDNGFGFDLLAKPSVDFAFNMAVAGLRRKEIVRLGLPIALQDGSAGLARRTTTCGFDPRPRVNGRL
jgi:hypothetical protein